MPQVRGPYDPERTREELMMAAMEEIHVHGFRAASLDRILKHTGVTKGALYHHFGSKKDLAYAVLDEFLPQKFFSCAREILETEASPLAGLIKLFRTLRPTEQEMTAGCPITNLANEMSPLDEGFRQRVVQFYDKWREMLTANLKLAVEAGELPTDTDVARISRVMIVMFSGTATLSKTTLDMGEIDNAFGFLADYLESLRIKAPS